MNGLIHLYGDEAREVVKSPQFLAYPMADTYRSLGKHLGLDFSPTVELMEYLPVFLSGARHKDVRRKVAETFSTSRNAQEANVIERMKIIKRDLLSADSKIDVSRRISLTLYTAIQDAVLEELKDQAPDTKLISKLPDLFDPKMSVKRRIEINSELGYFLNIECPRGKEHALAALATLVLGIRPLAHSLSLSIFKLAEQYQGARLSDITYPNSYPDSSLRFIDRIIDTKSEGQMPGQPIGARVRCVTFDERYSKAENALCLYGLGAHTCLGKPISSLIWNKLTDTLGTIDRRIYPDTLVLEKREPFLIAKECFVVLQ